MKEIKRHDIVAAVKHCPGHGATTKDSQFVLPVITKTKKEMEEDDTKSGIRKEDEYSFCFTLGSNKKVYKHYQEGEKDAIFCSPKFGPTFCSNIFAINNKFLKNGGYSTKKETSCFDGQNEDYELTGEQNFKIKELEVYEIITLKRV